MIRTCSFAAMFWAAICAYGARAQAPVPSALAAQGETTVLTVHAEGAQIYECKAESSGRSMWLCREPVATLLLIRPDSQRQITCVACDDRPAWTSMAETNFDKELTPISGAQVRAARALLKWSVRKLSDQCGVSESAISRGERVNGTPPMQVRNLKAIRQVFEEHGIEFLGFDGVRLLPGSSEN